MPVLKMNKMLRYKILVEMDLIITETTITFHQISNQE